MDKPDFSSRGKPVDQGRPDFSNRGRLTGQKPNYVIPKRVKVGPVELNLTDASDLQRLGSQGFVQGQMPRAVGAIGTVMGLPDAIRQRSFDPIAEAYRQNRQAEIDATDQARARAGLLGTAVEIGGSLVSGGGIANQGRKALANAPRVASGARKVAQAVAPRAGSTAGKIGRATARSAIAAGGGATAGAVYGSGEGRATENAIYGAVGGAAGEPVARAASAAVRGLRRVVGKPKVKPEVTAARQMAGKIRPDAEQVIAESQRLGIDPPALIDLMTNAGKRRVRAVSSADDAAQEVALAYREATRQGAQDRGQNIVRRMTGQDVNFPAAQEAAQANVRAVDDFNYGPIQNQRVNVTPSMLDSLRPADAQVAIANARRVAELSGRQDDVAALNTISNILRTGDVSKLEGLEVSTSALEQIYRSLRDTTSGLFADPSTRTIGNAMANVRDSFDIALQQQSPQIAQARSASREARQGADALNIGFEGLRPSVLPDVLTQRVGALPQSARPNVLTGAQAALQQQLGENPVNAINAMAYRPNMGARLEAMGAPAQDITQAAQYEISRLRNADFISPNTGSQTTPRLQDAAELTGAIPVTPQGIFTKMLDFAYRRASSFTPDEMIAMVRMGVEPADLQQLQALAAREPDKVPAAVQALIGTQLGIQSANQANAAGRYPAGQ